MICLHKLLSINCKCNYIFLLISEISLILKSQIPSLSRRSLYRCDDAFDNEIAAYKYVIPILRNFIIKRTGNNLLPYPVCIYAENDKNIGDVVILEDLCENGFSMTDRRKGLTYQQCCGVMKVSFITYIN